MFSRFLLALATLVLVLPVAAQEAASPWSGKATLGYLATTGNTENSNLNAGFEVAYAPGVWTHRLNAQAINANENDVPTAEAYELGWKSERRISDNDYLFGRLNWRKDRFSSYDTQFSQTLGYGHRLLNTDRHKLDFEVGGGARQSDLVDGTTESEFIARLGGNYRLVISGTSDFTQAVSVEAGDANTYIESKSALSARLVGNLSLVASYTVKHNTDVVPLTEKTDTYTALSLEYLW